MVDMGMLNDGFEAPGIGDTLEEMLRRYDKSDAYPFHMPGHKRNTSVSGLDTALDITEITGFDDLYHPSGILERGQKMAADIYGARRAWYLVNGSTVGNLSAVFASTTDGGRIIVDRGCHRSVHHAAKLRHLDVDYVDAPLIIPGIRGSVSADDVDNLLKTRPDTQAVIVTSAGYNGVKSDVEGIARVVHEHGAILICDEAHGAHFGFHEDYPERAIRQGADIVTVSLHKTLPAFTQSALLMTNNEGLIDRISSFLYMFQTSSPSYMLMAGMYECVEMMGREGSKRLGCLSGMVDDFLEETSSLRNIRVLTQGEAISAGAFDFDKSRLIILCPDGGGKAVFDRLSDRYRLELEASDDLYITAISTICDVPEGFERLAAALRDIDEDYPWER